MSISNDDRKRVLAEIMADDLSTHSREDAAADPAYRAALEDAEQMHEILDKLVKLRKALGLTQNEVAERMGVRQPTISSIENESSDPRLSTLQRYARAVEGQIHFGLAMPANCDWVMRSNGSSYQGEAAVTKNTSVKVVEGRLGGQWAAADSRQSHYDLFA